MTMNKASAPNTGTRTATAVPLPRNALAQRHARERSTSFGWSRLTLQVHIPQDIFLDFADGGFGQVVDDLQDFRQLETGQILFTKSL